MPGGDGTGPAGMGPMTGRAAGFCAGYPTPGYMNPVGGRGFGAFGRGRGGGGGWGRRNWFYATGLTGWQRAAMGQPAFGGPYPYANQPPVGSPAAGEVDVLKAQAEYFENALEDIKKRISELESQQDEKTEK